MRTLSRIAIPTLFSLGALCLVADPATAAQIWPRSGGGGGFAAHGSGGGIGRGFGGFAQPHANFGGSGFARPRANFGGFPRGFAGRFAPRGFGFGGRPQVAHRYFPHFGYAPHTGRFYGAPAYARHYVAPAFHGGPQVGATSPQARFAPTAVASYRQQRRFEHGNFDWRNFHRHRFIGWAGPVFWPYADVELYDALFWPYDNGTYYDAFWAYGYDDLFGGVLTPAVAVATTGAVTVPAPSAMAPLCSDATSIAGVVPDKAIRDALHPNPDQLAKLTAFESAEASAEKTLASSCATQAPADPLARLDAVQTRLQDMIQAVDTISTPLDDFYASLSDEQKAQFNQLGHTPSTPAPANFAAVCAPDNAVPVLDIGAVDKAIAPNAQQQADLAALNKAATEADRAIIATCPAQAPLTPPARLAAIGARLHAMLQGVQDVRPAFQTFWASLDANQHARFSQLDRRAIGRQG